MGEYDRVVSILTKERGKISAFAQEEPRKPGNRLAAATNPFSFGCFKLYEGKNSYTIAEADIQNYFEGLRTDYVGAYYGMYFTEVTEYYTRENNDEKEMLKLLYQSLRALESKAIPNRLVKCVFECKTLGVNGEFPGVPRDKKAGTVHGVCPAVHSGKPGGKAVYLYCDGNCSGAAGGGFGGIYEKICGTSFQKSGDSAGSLGFVNSLLKNQFFFDTMKQVMQSKRRRYSIVMAREAGQE